MHLVLLQCKVECEVVSMSFKDVLYVDSIDLLTEIIFKLKRRDEEGNRVRGREICEDLDRIGWREEIVK